MNFINKILFDQTSKSGKRFEFFIQTLIVISLLNFSFLTLPNLSDKIVKTLELIEIITVIVFSIEYIMRIIFSKQRIKFVFSFFGIVDFLAILPFYLSIGIDLRSIRAIRLFGYLEF